MDLKNKVALIIGSNGGIGKEIAVLLAKKGAKIIITYNKNKKRGEEAFLECSKYAKCMPLKLSVIKESSIKKAIKKVLKNFRKIDILINASGIMYRKPFIKHSSEEIQEQIAINLTGPMNAIKNALPYLDKEKAIIINIVSTAGKHVNHANHAPYCASKFGLRGFTQALALELPKHIKIYSVNPPPTATRMTGYKGISPVKVAEIVLKTAEEKIKKTSGSDIDVKDYL